MGEATDYRIGDIAKLAGVSKRTVDYYTKLGLLKPLRSENNYRCFSGESLVRIKLIQELKQRRFTLEEIRKHFDLLEERENGGMVKEGMHPLASGSIKDHLNQMQNQLLLLQPVINSLDQGNREYSTEAVRQLLMDSLGLIQDLMLLINELSYLI